MKFSTKKLNRDENERERGSNGAAKFSGWFPANFPNRVCKELTQKMENMRTGKRNADDDAD